MTFAFFMEGAHPQHYAVAVDSSGRCAYESRDSVDGDGATPEPYTTKFEMSETVRDRVFALARSLNYFRGNFDYKGGRIANTGRKQLAYSDPQRSFQTTYNWSTNRSIEELTEIFQNISNTQEFAKELNRLHRYDKLGLDAELRRMEEMASERRLGELRAIAPLLEELVADAAVMHVARERARRLLALAQAPPGKVGSRP